VSWSGGGRNQGTYAYGPWYKDDQVRTVTTAPFGSPAASSHEARRLCAPASRRVSPFENEVIFSDAHEKRKWERLCGVGPEMHGERYTWH